MLAFQKPNKVYMGEAYENPTLGNSKEKMSNQSTGNRYVMAFHFTYGITKVLAILKKNI